METKHADKRIVFETQMEGLQKNLLQMGNLVEEAIARAIESLKKQDLVMAEAVIKNDDRIDQLALKIEEGCLALIATQQPMAKDLRKVATLFKMIVDLERMADYATDIAKTVKHIGNQPLIKPLVDIPRMARVTQLMVKEALDSYIKEDVSLAVSMAQHDDEVDMLHRQIFRELLTIMMENPRTITQATYLLFISRYLERIADHATNIGENVVFLVTGEQRDLNE
ncbi:MAG: phosphate signaling complex protein PhoU [Bacillota bacterium]